MSEPLKDAEGLIERALHNPDGILSVAEEECAASDDTKKPFLKRMFQGVQTDISYMIPVIVAAGLMIGIGQLGASAFGIADKIGDAAYATDSNQLIVILHYLSMYGNMIMKFMYPVFAAFMAYSIADRSGLVPGFICGAFAAGLHYTFWGTGSGIPSGFFGALILGAVAGLVADYLNKHIHLHKNLQAMKPMLIVPGISVLIIFFLNFYLVDPVFGGLNKTLQDLIIANKDSGTILLCVIIAALTAFDLGGPVNKSAGAVAIGLAAGMAELARQYDKPIIALCGKRDNDLETLEQLFNGVFSIQTGPTSIEHAIATTSENLTLLSQNIFNLLQGTKHLHE